MEKISPVPQEQTVSTPAVSPVQQIPPVVEQHMPSPQPKKLNASMPVNIAISIVVVIAGVTTGWLLAGRGKAAGTSQGVPVQGASRINTEVNEELFPDVAEGVLMKGGHEGEGTHYLDRGQGEEKNVYLTSTVIDLESFVGKKVQVRGKAVSAQNVNYLMDVGTVKEVQ
ncbi:hypothetical protein A2801_02410 [Candidatus Woesebacteria bacterium RIFCSPHIGHO2_01_FULL_41_10]|uniref:Uncharacterized protein n=1 Tax=Candidatus Woesebacteria bacterium RIFCSPHIGHO2_01_FULL_41_10 TaxID=1802500 RepID=A0A1F7YRE3_9BACT|nr:MAG: hypothetical protein A2801_02410 [Candidatus Woesebacteria bacterium RIFCSPHIGHO2_01_FULL_41_10]